MTEMGLGGGVECQAHQGVHLRQADLLFEILDPNGVEPVADDTQGEVVFTTLSHATVTGDLCRILPLQCPCGSSLRLLEQIHTRISGQISLKSGNTLCLADLDEVLYSFNDLIDFTASINQRSNVDEPLLYLVLKSDQNSEKPEKIVVEALANLPAIVQSIYQQALVLHLDTSFSITYPIRPQKRTIEIIN